MNIFVSNLDGSITAGDLRQAFAGYGTVLNAIVMRETATGKSLGHGNVYLVPEQAALEAIADLHLAPLRGRPIHVRECFYRSGQDRRVRQIAGIKVERRRNRSDRRGEEAPHLRSLGSRP